jgi:ankyrin repeat protein
VGVLVSVIKSGGINQVREILLDQIDVEQCYEGERPLIYAIEMGNAAVVEELSIYQRKFHHQNLDVRTPSSKGQTPLCLAVCKGDVDIVKAVVDAEANSDADTNSNADSNSAVNTDPNALVNELFKNGRTPLMEAAFLGHAGVVTLLLERGANYRICTEQEKLNCLHFAVKKDNRAKEDVIIAFMPKMTFDQFPPDTPLHGPYETPIMLHIRRALEGQYGFLEIDSLWRRKFKALLKGGADVNRKYSLGTSLEKSSLQIAVMQKNVLMARLLVDGGATLPVSYIVPSWSSHDMKKILKRAPRVPLASRS